MLYRFGLWIYVHRWTVLLVWVLTILGAAGIAPRVTGALAAGGFVSPHMESQRAAEAIVQRFGFFPSALLVVFTPRERRADDPQTLDAIDAALRRVRALEEVAWVVSPSENPRQLSADETTAYAVIGLRSAPEEFRLLLPRIEGALGPPDLDRIVTGAPVFYDDIQAVTERDLRRAEVLSLPLAAAALLVVFGSVVAAGLPLIVGGAGVVVALAAMVLISGLTFLSIFSLNLVTMLGLALGIDYSLFLVGRFREELGGGRAVAESVAVAVSTAGRAVLFSGATVFVGLLALVTFPFLALRSLGVAGSLVVVTSVVAALTLLPAILALVGSGVDRWPVIRPRPGRSVIWSWVATRVMAHPLRVLVPVLAALLILGLPFLRVQFGAPDASILPGDVPSRRAADVLREKFGAGELSPIALVLLRDGAMLSPERLGQLYDFAQAVRGDPAVTAVESPMSLDPRLTREQYQLIYAQPDRITDPYAEAAVRQLVRDGVVLMRITSRGGQTSVESKELVRRLRAMPPPSGMEVLVGGGTAAVMDYSSGLYEHFPGAALLITFSTLVLLLVLFRSLVLPIKAIIMNVLSITASFGALVVVFQEGLLAGPLGFEPLGFVEASLPILMFCVLFGVSMDYEVFLLSRIMEAYQKSGDNEASVAQGLERSGAMITSAAAIIVLIAGSFVSADIILIKALGFGTAVAVFLDATLVRALLVPATMRLLGAWNWWAPAPVVRLLARGWPPP